MKQLENIDSWDDDEIERYAHHFVLPDIGTKGQEAIKHARVFIIGMGGLGSPLLLYLAAAGVGTIGIIDDDAIETSNLQRQILYTTGDIHKRKAIQAQRHAHALNPLITINAHPSRLTKHNIDALIEHYDIIADGSDNFATRYLVNDACYRLKKTLVSGACQGFEGQVASFRPWQDSSSPCYRCLFPEQDSNTGEEGCQRAGIVAPLAGIIGSLQALDVIKHIVANPAPSTHTLLLYDGRHHRLRLIHVTKNKACPLCGYKK